MSRYSSFHGEVYHGTETESLDRLVNSMQNGSPLLMSTHGAAGPGVYVTDNEDEARQYGDVILRGHAYAQKVLPGHVWSNNRALSRAGNRHEHAERVRNLLTSRGFDAVEDPTVRGGLALLSNQQFSLESVFDPRVGREVHPFDYLTTGPGKRPRRRGGQPAAPTNEAVWSPQTFGK